MTLDASQLCVVAPFCNPLSSKNRLANWQRFEDGVVAAGARLISVELAYGEIPFALGPRDGVQRVQLRGEDMLWHKENLINLGVAALAKGWKYVMWVDGDMLFQDPHWPLDVLADLQLHPVCQVSSHLNWLDTNGKPTGAQGYSFISEYLKARGAWRQGKFWDPGTLQYMDPGYPGMGWAWRAEAWQAVGGLLDICILGAGDYYMARGLFGLSDQFFKDNDYTQGYRDAIAAWGAKAQKAIGERVGYVPGLVFHLWHGALANRQYSSREQILIRNHYDPATDIVRDGQGLIGFAGNKPPLVADIEAYFRTRDEDSPKG
jgi:hypothetical protein